MAINAKLQASCITGWELGMLSKISSEICIFNLGYLSSGNYIYISKDVKNCGFFRSQKNYARKSLGSAVLGHFLFQCRYILLHAVLSFIYESDITILFNFLFTNAGLSLSYNSSM